MREARPRIAFMTGTDKAALLRSLIDDGELLAGVVLPFSSRREERLAPLIDAAVEANLEVLRPKRSDLTRVLTALEPDILLSAGYPYLLSSEQLAIARVNVNVHPTLLPKYRGPATAWHVIANGET